MRVSRVHISEYLSSVPRTLCDADGYGTGGHMQLLPWRRQEGAHRLHMGKTVRGGGYQLQANLGTEDAKDSLGAPGVGNGRGSSD